MGPTQARKLVPHGILLLQFRIPGNNKGSWLIYMDDIIFNMNDRSNFGLNVTYMGKEGSFGASETLGLDSLAL